MSSSGAIDFHNEAKVLRPGVVTGRSGSIGNVFYIDSDFWPLNTSLYVKDFHGNYPRFVYYLLLSFRLERFTSGAGVPTLNRNSVHGEKITVPEAFEEQKRIVAILDEAFAGIETAVANTEKNLSNARELFESYLNSVFSQRGEGWIKKPLVDSVDFVSTGPFGSLLHKADYISEGVPLVNPINITGTQIVPDKRKMIGGNKRRELQSYILNEGDVVIARRGEIGRCAVVTEHQHGWVCGTGCFFIRPTNSVNPHFLAHLLRSSSYRTELERRASGATMLNLSNKALSNLEITMPCLTEQDRILDQLSELNEQCQDVQSIYQHKLTALTELKQSLLHKAFSGELTTDKVVPGPALKEEDVA